MPSGFTKINLMAESSKNKGKSNWRERGSWNIIAIVEVYSLGLGQSEWDW